MRALHSQGLPAPAPTYLLLAAALAACCLEAQSTGSHERETTRVERWLYGLIVYILLTCVQLEA